MISDATRDARLLWAQKAGPACLAEMARRYEIESTEAEGILERLKLMPKRYQDRVHRCLLRL